MVALIVLGVGWFLLLLAGALYVSRREAIGVARAVGALSRSSIDAIPAGELVAISGEVRSAHPVDDPRGGDPVAYYEVEVERPGEKPFVTTAGSHITVIDAGGEAIEITLAGADIRVDDRDHVDAPWSADDRRALLSRLGEEAATLVGEARVRIKVLRLAETVTVIGVARARGEKRVLAADAGFLLLTPEPLEVVQAELAADTGGLDRIIRISAGLGVAAIVIGLVAFLIQR